MNSNLSFRDRLSKSNPLSVLFTLPLVAALDAGLIGSGRAAPAAPARAAAPMALRTIGVIGGIGPQATMDFEARVHRVAQARIPPFFNSGYPPLVVYYHRRPPVLVGENGLGLEPLQVDPGLLRAAERMGPMVDFLVITSNGAHRVAADIERAAGRPVLNMVDRVVEEVRRRGWRRVGLLTLGHPTVYSEPLGRLGIATETLGVDEQARLDRAIFLLVEGRAGATEKRVARTALAGLRRRGVDGIILGCTEIPFLVEPGGKERDLIDPLQVLAEAAVEEAMRPASSAGLAKP